MKKFKEGWVYLPGLRKAHYLQEPRLWSLCARHLFLGYKNWLKLFPEDELQRKEDRCKTCLKKLKKK